MFLALLRSFHMAHSMILQEGGMLTTLTAAVVLPLQEDDQYVVCVCNVGDSLAYVYSPAHGVREITQGTIIFEIAFCYQGLRNWQLGNGITQIWKKMLSML